MMNATTQNKLIVEYMRIHGSITGYDAQKDLSCMRLSARISELRSGGLKIITIKEQTINKVTGRKTSYARYKLSEVSV